MALTPDGRALTEAQRVGQNALAELAGRTARRGFYRKLSSRNIDTGRSAWVAESTVQAAAFARESQRRTGLYLSEYADAEGMTLDVVTPGVSRAMLSEQMVLSGPVAFKVAKSHGLDDVAAMRVAAERVETTARWAVMGSSRRMTLQTARHNGAHWRRVTDGKPCAFCAMLASRGPVYSEDTVNFRAHRVCGCTAEACKEDAQEWVPTGVESQWVEAYSDASDAASAVGQVSTAPVKGRTHSEDTILWRMRRQHPELFHDGLVDD